VLACGNGPCEPGIRMEPSGESGQPLIDLIRHHAVPLAIVVGVGAWVIMCTLAIASSARGAVEFLAA
jgi:hypothetical protein